MYINKSLLSLAAVALATTTSGRSNKITGKGPVSIIIDDGLHDLPYLKPMEIHQDPWRRQGKRKASRPR